uniref:Uncharacterized protein n=1 Tax=Setaria italica TaxID=4555 RepID=K3YFT4_SETIT
MLLLAGKISKGGVAYRCVLVVGAGRLLRATSPPARRASRCPSHAGRCRHHATLLKPSCAGCRTPCRP